MKSCLPLLFSIFLLSFAAFGQQPAQPDQEVPPDLQLVAVDVPTLLDIYEKTSGKILIRDVNIPAGTNIRIVAPGSLPKDETLRLLESVLLLNGYALVPGEDKSVKVINATGGKNPRSEGVAVYANLADLPKGDQVVTYFMQLQNVTAQEATTIFQGQIPPHPWGVFVPIPSAQAIAITENASTIRQMAKLKELIDVPPAKLVSRFVVLNRADAERVATIITKLIEDRKSKSQENTPPPAGNNAPQNNGQPAGEGGGGGASPALNERNLVVGDVQLIPDPRTNRILVVTRPINFEYIKGLIEEFDVAVGLTTPLDRPLKYLVASEILPVLETILTEGADEKTLRSNNGSTNGNTTNGNNGSNTNGLNGNSSGSGSQFDASKTLQEKANTAPQAILVGKTRLIADNQANSIIVIGPPENVDKVRTILDSLDKKPMQVYLSTVIGQLTLNDSSELSIDILQKYTKVGDWGTAGSLRTRSDGILDPASLTSVAAFTSLPAGLTLYGAIGSALDYYVKALASTNRFKLISRPVVYTTNNKGALIASGQKIAVPTSTLTSLDGGVTADAGSVVSNIDYTAVELKLEVVPTINSNREVTLKIKQTNDSVVGNTVISGNSIPTIGTQTVDTTVTVPNGATIVLGGLITEDNNTTISGVPYLKDIPVLGYLFKGTTKTKNRSELIIMIQPVVVGSNLEEIKASQGEVDRNKFGPESKAFSDNVPYIPPDKKKSPTVLKTTPRGLTPPSATSTPKTTPMTPSPTNNQLYP